MKQKVVLPIILAIIAGGIFIFSLNHYGNKPSSTFDPSNATYTIDGQAVTLVNGKAEAPAAPGSAEQVTTAIFGQPVQGDLNGDGTADSALMLVQDSGGSGTFYYAAAAINATSGAQGTNAVLLGDRIAPQNLQIQNAEVLVNYADRKPGEPMSATPSVGITKYLKYNGSILVEVPSQAGLGEHCGGNMATAAVCAAGLHCAPAPGSHLPFGDVGGVCIAD